ncbi:hypothetical protein RND81_05G054100 [Saponaria officinalis]|uniref:Protein FAR1-RELATED SEQUENCE n=1 Tax=Saponaria officinalis TaxID=3572 RepID=A0AAW1KSS6_SAPOF
MFERKGILCRHILWIYSSNGQKTIPGDYVAKRWTKDAVRFNMLDCDGETTEDIDIIDGQQIEMLKLWSEVHETIGLLRGMGKAEVDSLCTLIRGFKEKLSPTRGTLNKQQELEKILGCTTSEEISIFPPKHSKNKGSGKRMLSSKTKAVALAKKPKRMCNNCKKMAHHDKRNCPNPYSEHPPLPEDESEEEQEEDEEEEEDDEAEEHNDSNYSIL